ncbi:MAG: hypothetical protein RR922_02890 [Clostridia bacterium]
MKKLMDITLVEIAKTLSKSFLEDPLCKEMLNGIEKKERFYFEHFLMQVKIMSKEKGIDIICLEDNPKMVLIGNDTSKYTRIKNNMLYLKVGIISVIKLEPKSLGTLIKNLRRIQNASGVRWHQEFVGKKYYDLKFIAIDEHLRGIGNFRKIITPIIEYSKDRKLPIVLETYNIRNVSIYEHFGFELVKTISDEKNTELKQYCMVKKRIKKLELINKKF